MTGSRAGRLVSAASNVVTRKARVWTHREQHHRVGDVEIALPPGHQLPYFQRRHPTYDRYAVPLLARLAAGVESLLVVDVGANVGDTAVAALSAAENISVLSVEGNPVFCDYWRRNLAPYAARSELVEGFVGPVGDGFGYRDDGSTGRFVRDDDQAVAPTDWVSPSDLLSRGEGYSRVVWKSDIDGFDIHVLARHWEEVASRADVIWFEYDPCTTAGDPKDVDRLVDHLTRSELRLAVYDNLGRRLVTSAAGAAAGELVADLTDWLREQRRGQVTVPYLDIWAVRDDDDLVAALLGR